MNFAYTDGLSVVHIEWEDVMLYMQDVMLYMQWTSKRRICSQFRSISSIGLNEGMTFKHTFEEPGMGWIATKHAMMSLIKQFLDIPFMVVYSCKKCGELNNLTPHAFQNITGFGAKCEKCETINTVTLENGALKKTIVVSK